MCQLIGLWMAALIVKT